MRAEDKVKRRLMFNIVRQTKYSLILIAVAIAAWITAFSFMPDYIPMQYTYVGEEIWSTNKYLAGISIVSLMLFIYLIALLKPKINPAGKSYSFLKKGFKKRKTSEK